MIQEQAFDPESGAPLSEDKEYPPWYATGVRQVEQDPVTSTVGPDGAAQWHGGREGALTNGELESSRRGLLGYFRRVLRKSRDPDPKLEMAAASALRKLKAVDSRPIDTTVWWALAERLAQEGHWSAWMFSHVIPRCPRCHSRLKFRAAVYEMDAICATSPNRHGTVNDEIAEAVLELHEAAFDDVPDEPVYFDPD